MKKFIFAIVGIMLFAANASATNYVVVNSNRINNSDGSISFADSHGNPLFTFHPLIYPKVLATIRDSETEQVIFSGDAFLYTVMNPDTLESDRYLITIQTNQGLEVSEGDDVSWFLRQNNPFGQMENWVLYLKLKNKDVWLVTPFVTGPTTTF